MYIWFLTASVCGCLLIWFVFLWCFVFAIMFGFSVSLLVSLIFDGLLFDAFWCRWLFLLLV